MSLFIYHSLFRIGKIQEVDGNRVEVLFPRSKSEQLKKFTVDVFGVEVRRHILEPGTPCVVKRQPCTIECLLQEGEGSTPHKYQLIGDDGEHFPACEESIELPNINDEHEDDESAGQFRIGIFVTAHDRHGIGKILAIHGNECDVAFFHHPGTEDIRRYATADLERAPLSPETRVFLQQDDRWNVGRVTDYLSGRHLLYTIRFPDKQDRHVAEEELYVRCLSAKHSPVDLMSYRGMQTQFFHDARMEFVRCITKLRNISQGLSCVLSSSVELVAHQIRAAQQVLTDPLQRYVLADEVGLGKTIEAGFIIRQTLLDHPGCRVVVLVPPQLIEQWAKELTEKFQLTHFSPSPQVVTFDQIDQINAQDLELLVIDEAHNIFSPESSNESVTMLAQASRRLLLLSATPVIGHEQTFLNMLKVLDPDIYMATTIDSFREKIEHRQQYGALARMLGGEISPIFLRATLAHANELLASDPVAMQLLKTLENALESGEGSHLQEQQALHRHIVEHHRIFHRLIRNRRKDIADNAFLPRHFDKDQQHVRFIPNEDQGTTEIVGLFEEWRLAAHEELNILPKDLNRQNLMAQDCARLFEAVGAGSFGPELDRMVQLGRPGGGVNGVDALVTAAMEIQEAIPTPVEDMNRAVQKAIELKRANDSLHSEPIHMVAFFSTPSLCRELEAAYTPPPEVQINFLSRNNEEGQNFQHAHVIIHMDIPLDPVRMEQRIGRLDRFNRSARTLLHVCRIPGILEDSNPWFAWLKTLVLGFRMFNEPISDVQFLLENERTLLAGILLSQGVAGIEEYCNSLPDRLTAERNSLDEQYEFDQRSDSTDSGIDWFDTLMDVDEDESEIKRSIYGLFQEALKLDARWGKGDVRYSWKDYKPKTLIPETPWKNEFYPGLDLPSTFSRIKAVRNPGLNILRIGHPLVDAVERFCRWDIRGIAFATWRANEEWPLEEPQIGLKLDYVIEGDLHELENDITSTSILASARRRTDGLLPPWVETIYLDSHLSPVHEGPLLERMSYPYKKGPCRDFNLQKRLKALDSLIDADQLSKLASEAAETGATIVRSSAHFSKTIRQSATTAKVELEHRLQRLHSREQYLSKAKLKVDSAREEMRFEQLIANAVIHPSVRLESIGLFVLASNEPENSVWE